MLMLVRYGASRNSAANIDYFSLLDVLMYYIYCTIKYCTYGLFLLGFLFTIYSFRLTKSFDDYRIDYVKSVNSNW